MVGVLVLVLVLWGAETFPSIPVPRRHARATEFRMFVRVWSLMMRSTTDTVVGAGSL